MPRPTVLLADDHAMLIDAQGLAGLAADGRTALRFQYNEVSTWKEYQTDMFVATSVRTGRVNHRLVAGVEAGLSTADSEHLQSGVFA